MRSGDADLDVDLGRHGDRTVEWSSAFKPLHQVLGLLLVYSGKHKTQSDRLEIGRVGLRADSLDLGLDALDGNSILARQPGYQQGPAGGDPSQERLIGGQFLARTAHISRVIYDKVVGPRTVKTSALDAWDRL